jgi:DNA repair protein RadD
MQLRPYQERTIVGVHQSLQSGKRAPCVVSPTGSGKTVMALALAEAAGGCLFVVHTKELLLQTAAKFREHGWTVSIIAPGYYPVRGAQIHVATVQTLIKRSHPPTVPLVIIDECHHFVPDLSWFKFIEHYGNTPRVGFTATPQRSDGKPLGDTFDDMIVSAQYSELIELGYLVPCRVMRPPETLGRDLAMDPVEALAKYGSGQSFVFTSSVKSAREYAGRIARAACIDAKTPAEERRRWVKAFKAGELDVLTNKNVLTEGVDVPEAVTCVLAGSCLHVSTFLQRCGRVLRSAAGKKEALIIDLVGATHLHGFPTMDRVYTLDGKGIAQSDVPPLRNCPQCGTTLPASLMLCDCGYRFKKRDPRIPRIFNLELEAVYAEKNTPDDAKRAEYERLRAVQREKGYSLKWVKDEYKKLFRAVPLISDATREEKQAELRKLQAVARQRGFKAGWVGHMFKAQFGSWPQGERVR